MPRANPRAPIGCHAEVDRRPSTLVVGTLLAFVVFTSVGLVLLPGVSVAGGSSGSTKGQPTLALLGQSPWVGPDESFAAHLEVKGATASSAPALKVTVYSYLTSRSAFDQTLTGPPTGRVLSQSAPVAVSTLPSSSGGGFNVSVAVGTGSLGSSAPGSPFSVDLRCPLGSCGGVYPVTLTLTNASGKTTFDQLTTYLVYDAPATSTERLRLSVVVPLGLAPQAPDAIGNLAPPSEGSLESVTALAAGLATHPEVPVTVDPDPASALTMSTDGRPSAHRALASVIAASAVASRQVVCSPFTAVNPSAMFADGLGTELSDQITRGAQVLSALGSGRRHARGRKPLGCRAPPWTPPPSPAWPHSATTTSCSPRARWRGLRPPPRRAGSSPSVRPRTPPPRPPPG